MHMLRSLIFKCVSSQFIALLNIHSLLTYELYVISGCWELLLIKTDGNTAYLVSPSEGRMSTMKSRNM